jgi:hypothetical protein
MFVFQLDDQEYEGMTSVIMAKQNNKYYEIKNVKRHNY